MKKLIYLGMVVLALTLFGCGKKSVEDVAKDYVKKQLTTDKNASVDTSKLEYKVKKEGDDKATVTVTGKIKYEAKLFFVKKDKKWEIAEEVGPAKGAENIPVEVVAIPPAKVEKKAASHEAAPAHVEKHAPSHHE